MAADTETPVLEGQRAVAPQAADAIGDNPPPAQPDIQVVEAAPLLQDRRRVRSSS